MEEKVEYNAHITWKTTAIIIIKYKKKKNDDEWKSERGW